MTEPRRLGDPRHKNSPEGESGGDTSGIRLHRSDTLESTGVDGPTVAVWVTGTSGEASFGGVG